MPSGAGQDRIANLGSIWEAWRPFWPHSAGLSAAVHAWRLTEKACPNEAIVARRFVERTGLKGLAALKAAGLFDKFDKPAVNTPAVKQHLD
jgi:hypothetical protein